ncbi:MAG TPA: hypothetical protein VGG16_06755 [Streptosporangiaceae bacterium]
MRARNTWWAAASTSASSSSAPFLPDSESRKPGWLNAARRALVRSDSPRSRGRSSLRTPCTAPASSRLVAGSSTAEEASSNATDDRRNSAASRAALAMSTRPCSRSIRPARQDT